MVISCDVVVDNLLYPDGFQKIEMPFFWETAFLAHRQRRKLKKTESPVHQGWTDRNRLRTQASQLLELLSATYLGSSLLAKLQANGSY